MPWMQADMARAYEPWVLSLLLGGGFVLTALSVGGSWSWVLPAGLALGVPVLALLLRRAQRWDGYQGLYRLMMMLLLGHLGMLLGAAVDFGPLGLLLLASWCSTVDGAGPVALWSKFGIAPWSHLGMLLGCNLGMVLSLCNGGLGQGRRLPAYLLLSNLGMLLGLMLSDVWATPASADMQLLAVVLSLEMLLAMALGMLGVWKLAEYLSLVRLGGRIQIRMGGV